MVSECVSLWLKIGARTWFDNMNLMNRHFSLFIHFYFSQISTKLLIDSRWIDYASTVMFEEVLDYTQNGFQCIIRVRVAKISNNWVHCEEFCQNIFKKFVMSLLNMRVRDKLTLKKIVIFIAKNEFLHSLNYWLMRFCAKWRAQMRNEISLFPCINTELNLDHLPACLFAFLYILFVIMSHLWFFWRLLRNQIAVHITQSNCV
jgi:hypothetical protein